MRRDGSQSSVWQPCINNSMPLADRSGYEVKISGNGVTALAAAALLQQQGKKCVLVTDQETQLPPTAYLTTILPEGYRKHSKSALIADGMRTAIDLAEEWIISSEMECDLVYEPGYLFSAQTSNDVPDEKLAAETAGLVTTMVKSIPVPVPFTKACRFEYQARFNPAVFCMGLTKVFTEAGGVLVDRNTADEAAIVAQHTVVLDDAATANKRNSYHLAFTLASGIYPYGIAQCHDNGSYSFQRVMKDGKEYVLASLLDVSRETDTTIAFDQLEQVIRASFNVATIDFQWMNTYCHNCETSPLQLLDHEIRYQHAEAGSTYFTMALLAAQVIADLVSDKENCFTPLFASQINHLTGSEV